MQSPAVSRPTLKRAIASRLILVSALLAAVGATARAAPNPVTINFDNLGPGVIVSNQYSPQVIFSAPTGYYGCTLYTGQTARSAPRSLVSRYNSCDPFVPCGTGEISITFPTPVKNFSFYVLNSWVAGYHLFYIDVYVSGSFYGRYEAFGTGQPSVPMLYDKLKSISNITGVYIHFASNTDYYGYAHDLFYDDFTFTPNFDVNITSGRISGNLNSTTKNAMLGADVALNASVTPSTLTGGTFSWTATGPKQQVSTSSTGPSYTVRWTDTGTYQVKVTYTRNGFTAASFVNLTVVMPKLTAFTATQAADRIVSNQCTGDFPPAPDVMYILGCPHSPDGIMFSATAQIPSGSYLSDLDQSRLKFVQIVSLFRKDISYGQVRCATARTSETDTGSGWQLDNVDPYFSGDLLKYPIPAFSSGNTLTFKEVDSPSLNLTTPIFMYDKDAQYTNDVFEIYVVYFTGTKASTPIFQRAIGLQNSAKPVARLAWSWGGQSVYDPASPNSYQLQFSLVPPRTYVAEAVDAMRPYSGNAGDINPAQCPGGPPMSNNPIDSSRFFVRQQYCDILGRPPDAAWIYWIREITLCAFDQTCINNRRIAVVRGFFESGEFRQKHPKLQNPGAPGYNEEYVKQLYKTLLRREPDAAYLTWIDILNRTGDYDGVIGGFINSNEYRNVRTFVPCS